MSNKSRGSAFETRIKKYLESLGFKVDKARAVMRCIGPNKWISSQNDFFGCIDLMAIHPKKSYTLMIQCTLDSHVDRKKSEMAAMPWNFTAQRVQLWLRQDGVKGGIRIEELKPKDVWIEHIFRLKDGELCPPLQYHFEQIYLQQPGKETL